MPYEFKKADVYEFADTISVPKKEKGGELFFTYCPYCHGGGHDKDTFSINLETGVFNCFRSSCGRHGYFVELARDFNFALDMGEKKEYRTVSQKPITVRPKAVEYMAGRGIGQGVVERYHITTRLDDDNVLVFPFHDENNVRQFVKYRNTRYNGKGSKEWCEANTKPILFGMADYEAVIKGLLARAQIQRKRIMDYINGIDDGFIRQIIFFRHVSCMTWNEVADSIGGGNTEENVKKRYYRFFKKQKDVPKCPERM